METENDVINNRAIDTNNWDLLLILATAAKAAYAPNDKYKRIGTYIALAIENAKVRAITGII